MDRRKFMSISATGVAGLMLSDTMMAASKQNNQDTYSLVILGDTHYDTEPATHYHAADLQINDNKLHKAEFLRNGTMWRLRSPKILDRAKKLVSNDTKMILHMGDLVQGDCGSADVHKQMLIDALNIMKNKVNAKLPFVTVVGNHDIRGLDAKETYHQFMPKYESTELGLPITKTTFSFNIGDDAYIVIDFNDPDADLIDKLLKDTRNARHTFIVSHGPLFPYDSKYYNWYLYGGRKSAYNKEAVDHFHKEFAKRNAICLCGHTHFTELLDWYGEGGRITQMTMNSVWAKEEYGKYVVDAEGAEQYGMIRCQEQKDLFDLYRPGIKRYSLSRAAGCYKLNVTPQQITVDFYAGESESLSHRFVLRG